uniref:Cation/H+ exchanger transmembrane domain-containing protein n=1 Tax=Prolemur simus TaxID=1328070 RepID=A0A8C8ZNB2_PROSS
MDANTNSSSNLTFSNKFSGSWLELLWSFFLTTPDDLPEIILIISLICTIGGDLIGMSGVFTLAIVGLLLSSTSFKPGGEALLLEFWNCLAFIAFLMVFTFVGLFIPDHTYFYITFSDIYYSLSIYFMLIVLRLLVFLLMSPALSRVGRGFNWRCAFIMVWSEVKGTPNISMALLFAYSDLALGSERQKSQVLFHGLTVCLISLIVNRFILPRAVTRLGLRDVTSTKYKSVYYTFQHFQELTKSSASALKFDKDLANADWNMVEKAITLENPYTLHQGETTEHQKVKCPNCNKDIDEALNIEAMELANRRLLSAQIASYQRQYRNEILTQSAVQVLVGAAGSFGEKGECISIETIRKYSESRKILIIIRKILLNWVYKTKKENEISSGHFCFRICHKIVFTAEFEYVGYLVTLLNTFPIIMFWIPHLGQIYDHEIKRASYIFLAFYILEGLLKLITPKLLQLTDKRMSHLLSFWYAVLKGYVQGESDVVTIIDQIASSKQAKQVRKTLNTKKSYLECDHPEIAITMKTKEEVNVMLNMAKEIIKAFRLKGIIHKVEGTEIEKLIMTKKRQMLEMQSVIKPLTVEEVLYHVPWLDKEEDYIKLIQLKQSKPGFGIDQILESEEKDQPIIYTDYILSGEMIGELNCLTNEPMKCSATCKTVVETCFIPKHCLYEVFEECPLIEHNMWLKIGLAITARKIREHLSYEDWNYKLQLKLSNVHVKDIPKNTKISIYDETVTYVIVINGAVEDCQLRKAYKAPCLIPITCHQIQGTENFTKVMIIQTSTNTQEFRWNSKGEHWNSTEKRGSRKAEEREVRQPAWPGLAGRPEKFPDAGNE